MREALPEITRLGGSVVAVATGAHHQAAHLEATTVPFPCLVDPSRDLYRALGLGHIRWRQFARLSTWRRYLAGLGPARPGRITGDPLQAPGVAIIDGHGVLRYLHRGATLGDYPPVVDVLEALRVVTAE